MTTTAPANTETGIPTVPAFDPEMSADVLIHFLIGELRKTVAAASTGTPQGASLGAYASMYAAIDNARRDLAQLADQVTASAAATHHDKRTVVEGVGVVEFHYKSTKTVWDHQVVQAAIWDAACVNTDTGEVTDQPAPARLLHLLTDSFGMTASTGWKVTALRANVPDLDMDEARVTTPGALAMRII